MFKYIFRFEVQGLNISDFFAPTHECSAPTEGEEEDKGKEVWKWLKRKDDKNWLPQTNKLLDV